MALSRRNGEVQAVQFTCKSIFRKNLAIVHCSGNLGCDEAIVLSRAAIPLLREKRVLVLDFQAVECLDSGGLGTLVLLHMYACSCRRALRLCGLNPRVRELVELAGLHTLLDIYPSQQQARSTSVECTPATFTNN